MSLGSLSVTSLSLGLLVKQGRPPEVVDSSQFEESGYPLDVGGVPLIGSSQALRRRPYGATWRGRLSPRRSWAVCQRA